MEKQMTPKEIIDDIRQNDHFIGLRLPDAVARGIRNMREDYSEALSLLSEDLYSKKTHFVLELTQHADDNQYEQDVEPAITFVNEGHRLVVRNNEKGFTEI